MEEIDLAAKLAKITKLDPLALNAKAVVEMATIDGARALHMEKEIGSLEAGKKADIVLISLDEPNAVPMYDIYAQLAYALKGSDAPFDERIHEVRGQPGQIAVAREYRDLIAGSAIRASHLDCTRVQDPYSFRCQPQVMGACLDLIRNCSVTLELEANAVTDNPLLFVEAGEVLSGGNFHAEPVAFAADTLALALAEIGSMAERRVAVLVDPKMSGLPAFLVENSGVNSGFMMAQVTAAALVSENKTIAVPCSVDSIPTSANQEDHVSMATHGARRLGRMVDNAAAVIGIELLAAAQGIDFHRPARSSVSLEQVHAAIRGDVPYYAADRYVAPDIQAAQSWVKSGRFSPLVKRILPSRGGA